jgi:hypothetical protein
MKTFSVKLRYQDRKLGSEGSTIKVNATNLAGAISKGTREFLAGLDRKARFDANKNGLRVEAIRVGEVPEVS